MNLNTFIICNLFSQMIMGIFALGFKIANNIIARKREILICKN